QAVGRGDAQHPPEPVLRLYLQRRRRADRSGRALSVVRDTALASDRGGRDGAVVGERDRQCAEIAFNAALMKTDTALSHRHRIAVLLSDGARQFLERRVESMTRRSSLTAT